MTIFLAVAFLFILSRIREVGRSYYPYPTWYVVLNFFSVTVGLSVTMSFYDFQRVFDQVHESLGSAYRFGPFSIVIGRSDVWQDWIDNN